MRIQTLVVLVMIAACGGGDAKPDGGGDLDAASFPAEYLRILCEVAEHCGTYATAEQCRATVPFAGAFDQAVAGVAADVVRFDAEAAAACLESQRDDDCRDPRSRVHDDPCLRVYTGLVADGAACQYGDECASGGCDRTDPACEGECCAGTCEPDGPEEHDLPIGSPCSGDEYCVDTAYCNASAMCTALIADEGAACEDYTDCAAPLVCDVNAAQPVCRRPAEPGETCVADRAGACADQRDRCIAGTCQRAVEPGATCDVDAFDCVFHAECVNGSCVARPTTGEACDPTGPRCMGVSPCRNGTCAAPPVTPVCTMP